MPQDILEIYAKDEKMNGLRKDGSKIKIMIVDDSLAFRRLLRRVLETTGYIVEECSDGKEAIAKYSIVRPDIVAMDITMPEMEGPVAVDIIRRNHPDAKVVMITAIGHKEIVEDCIKKGAKGYILKPLTDSQIPKALETIKKIALEV